MPERLEVIAVLAPSPARRWVAVGTMVLLGAICLCLAAFTPPADPAWLVLLLAIGGGALWLATRLAAATRTRIELTEAGLHDGEGRILAPIAGIDSVDRSVFAFKPTNGFLVRLSEPAQRAWQPGLWWRFGRRLGVGGVTPSAQGRLMADALAALLAERSRTNRLG